MFQCGYFNVVANDINGIGGCTADLKTMCEKLVIGIPDELTYARLYGDAPYSPESIRTQLLEQTQADEVLIVEGGRRYEQIWEDVRFDVIFYGSQFGKAFDDFSAFAAGRGISLHSLLPDRFIPSGTADALKIALENLQRHQKIVLFGTGKYFDLYMEHYGARFRPAYAMDNDEAKHGTCKAGLAIYPPARLKEELPEDVLVIICAKDFRDMQMQLRDMGGFDYRPMVYNNPVALLEEYTLAREGELAYVEDAHAVLAEMLREFDRVCQKHHLRYYMICGSLIGVLRHRGFIPWDDDVDVAMPREDYERLRKIAADEWAGTPYRVQGIEQYGNGAFLDCMPRVLNMSVRLPMKVYDKMMDRASEEYYNRPFLDIYVLDNAFDDDKKHMFCMNMMKGVYNLLMGHRGQIDYAEYAARLPGKTIRLMKFLHAVGRCLPLPFLIWWYEHLSRKANRRKCENYFMPSCAITCIERKFKKAFFKEGIRKPFLDFEVTVPSDYDGLMEAMGYHRYMQFPRMSIRKPSHYFNSDIIIW